DTGAEEAGEQWNTNLIVDHISIYPEYLADPAVALCPSATFGTDPADVFDQADNAATVWNGTAYVPTSGVPNRDFYPCEINYSTVVRTYNYYGWLLAFPEVTAETGPITDVGNNGFDDADLLLGAPNHVLSFTGGTPNSLQQIIFGNMNPDVDITGLQFTTTGRSVDVVRLREGSERFLVTDINNPAGASQAQSEIALMYDIVSATGNEEFNHIPGGSNVLFMDGHVEFIKYGSKWPVVAAIAVL